jgi:hypothetical protein
MYEQGTSITLSMACLILLLVLLMQLKEYIDDTEDFINIKLVRVINNL